MVLFRSAQQNEGESETIHLHQKQNTGEPVGTADMI